LGLLFGRRSALGGLLHALLCRFHGVFLSNRRFQRRTALSVQSLPAAELHGLGDASNAPTSEPTAAACCTLSGSADKLLGDAAGKPRDRRRLEGVPAIRETHPAP